MKEGREANERARRKRIVNISFEISFVFVSKDAGDDGRRKREKIRTQPRILSSGHFYLRNIKGNFADDDEAAMLSE